MTQKRKMRCDIANENIANEDATVEEMEDYVDWVCYDEKVCEDYPRRYDINYGEKIWDYADYFIRAKKMSIKPTRYLDEDCIEALGIKDDVHELFGNIGWNEFMVIKKPTYRELTMEVLSTIVVSYDNDNVPEGMSFRLGNQDRYLTRFELNNIFHTPNYHGNDGYHNINSFDSQSLWRSLARKSKTDRPFFDPSHSKASLIRSPVFRYIQRVLANTIFARSEVGSVRKEELYLIHCMIHNKPVNMAIYLINQLARQCRAPVKKCQIGGFITHIADHFGSTHHLQFQPIHGDTLLDLQTLRRMTFIEKVNDVHCLVIDKEASFPLPNSQLTNWKRKNAGNWDLLSKEHDTWRSNFDNITRQQTMCRGEGSRSQQVEEEEMPQAPPRNEEPLFVYLRRSSKIAGLTRRFDELSTQVAGIAAAQTQLSNQMQEYLDMQRAVYEWHIREGHIPQPGHITLHNEVRL
ncbi:hypothetical protein ACS0TY_015313 [Phlomoides rotata]